MPALSVVKAFRPVNDIESHIGPSRIAKLIHTLDLEGLEETLDWRIVPAICFAAHRLDHPVILDQLSVIITGILTATIRGRRAIGRLELAGSA